MKHCSPSRRGFEDCIDRPVKVELRKTVWVWATPQSIVHSMQSMPRADALAVRHRPATSADENPSAMTPQRRVESATNVSLIGAGWVARAGYATVKPMKPTAINFHRKRRGHESRYGGKCQRGQLCDGRSYDSDRLLFPPQATPK